MLLPWFFAHQVLTFSVFCGIIGIVHSDDPFELLFGYSILLQIRYYGYLFFENSLLQLHFTMRHYFYYILRLK